MSLKKVAPLALVILGIFGIITLGIKYIPKRIVIPASDPPMAAIPKPAVAQPAAPEITTDVPTVVRKPAAGPPLTAKAPAKPTTNKPNFSMKDVTDDNRNNP